MRSIRGKLTMGFVLVSLISVGLAALLMSLLVTRGFDRYLLNEHRQNFMSDAISYYSTTGSWDGIERGLDTGSNDRPAPPPEGGTGKGKGENQPPPNDDIPARFVLVDSESEVLVGFDGYKRGDILSEAELNRAEPLFIDDQLIGYVLTTDDSLLRDPDEERYIERANFALMVSAGGALLAALVIGLISAGFYTRPLRELNHAIHQMRDGDLEHQVPVRSKDEIGELAAGFNQMSQDLAHAAAIRRQMTADIAHDLRTPLTVIAGHLEAMRDGVLQPTEKRFETLSNEVEILEGLVEDLRVLSLADAGELHLDRQPVAPHALLERAAEVYHQHASQAGVQINVESNPSLPTMYIDPERMMRVLGNLVSNALRYTPQEGSITLSANSDNTGVHLSVADTGQGIPKEKLPFIFERFYQADSSRAHASGEGSGLGLAIVKSIIEAHGGTISVASEPGRGTRFTMTLQPA